MLEKCKNRKKCKNCHEDLDINKALIVFHTCLMYEINHFDKKEQGEICLLYRKIKAYELIKDTLKKYGLCE